LYISMTVKSLSSLHSHSKDFMQDWLTNFEQLLIINKFLLDEARVKKVNHFYFQTKKERSTFFICVLCDKVWLKLIQQRQKPIFFRNQKNAILGIDFGFDKSDRIRIRGSFFISNLKQKAAILNWNFIAF